MRFLEAINRWQVVAVVLAVVVAIELGLYFFYYSPNRPSEPGSLPGQGVTTTLEKTAPTTVSKTSPARQSKPPPSKTQYRP